MSGDTKKGQGRAGLGAFATHRRKHVDQRDVVRQNGADVDEVLDVLAEVQLGRTAGDLDEYFEREPGGAGVNQAVQVV